FPLSTFPIRAHHCATFRHGRHDFTVTCPQGVPPGRAPPAALPDRHHRKIAVTTRTMPDQAISVSQLESHLWEAANILRGPVDAADFKTYVFPLLFFKRISDVHDEEYLAALGESGGDEE